MKYLCLAYYDEARYAAAAPAELERLATACRPLDEALRASGQLDEVGSLQGGAVATLRPRHDEPASVDEPARPGASQVGAFFILEARDFNDALRAAGKHPAARLGAELGWAVEVRPIERLDRLAPG